MVKLRWQGWPADAEVRLRLKQSQARLVRMADRGGDLLLGPKQT